MLSVTAMMDLEAPIVHSEMSMNANIGLVPYMQNVQTPWAVLLVRVEKVRTKQPHIRNGAEIIIKLHLNDFISKELNKNLYKKVKKIAIQPNLGVNWQDWMAVLFS